MGWLVGRLLAPGAVLLLPRGLVGVAAGVVAPALGVTDAVGWGECFVCAVLVADGGRGVLLAVATPSTGVPVALLLTPVVDPEGACWGAFAGCVACVVEPSAG